MVRKSPEKILVERQGSVATVIINRPHVRNAIDNESADLLAAAFLKIEADKEIKVAVLWGVGGTFCAGADLKVVASGERFERYDINSDSPMGPCWLSISKPVIAAVAGHAVAGGLEIALWCDLRVAEEDSIFGVFSRRWGMPLMDGGTVRLPRLIGQGRAADMILTGRPVGAREAFEFGLANRIVSTGSARLEAETLAANIAKFPQMSLKNDLASVEDQWGLSAERALRSEFTTGIACVEREGQLGAGRFVQGHGRGGSFSDL
mgnify:CR=1 FL=1